MKKLLLLAVCLALLIAFDGCGKSESGSSGKSSPSQPSGPPPGGPGGPPGGSPGGPYGKAPMPGGPPGMTGGPTAPGSPDAAKPEAKPAPKPFDDHSDDPWYDEDAAAKPGTAGEKKPAGMASSWKLDKALLDQLEPYQDVEGYQIRLPKGFNATPLPITPPQGQKLFHWMAPRQGAGGASSTSFVQVFLATAPSPEAAKANLEPALTTATEGMKRDQREWKQMPAEAGRINGLPCLRVKFQGVLAGSGAKTRGFAYAAQDGSVVIAISVVSAGDNAEALKLAEAAALTFRKK